MQAKKAWESILKILKLKLSQNEFDAWFPNVLPVSITQNKLILSTDNEYLKEKIEKQYLNTIKDILNDILIDIDAEKKDVEIVIVRQDMRIPDELNQNKSEDKRQVHQQDNDYNNSKDTSQQRLNKRYCFENFIVGKSNEFAHAAARAVATSPGKVYNPLFIYGGVGLGKTHLMHAIGNYIMEKNSEAKVHYCSCEQFTNDLINSLKRDKMQQFREKYRKLDILLIDDIQFIIGKESTQEEFFHTFNTLHQYFRQVVISSDRSPNEMKNVEERLVSRFAWGLIADVKAPDYETRVAILKNKAELEGINISEESLAYIADAIKSNIRELEGSLNRIAAKASLLGRKIDFDLIQEVFKGFIEDRAKKVTKHKIIKSVSEFYNISSSEIESNKRTKEIAKARQVSMYFMRNLLNSPFSSIGESFGGRDHTTVMHSVNKIDVEQSLDKSLKFELDQIKQSILK
jgi:chromosomal replication initiator protein